MPTNDDPPVITVDWDSVEDELDRTISTDQRHEIEQTGIMGLPLPTDQRHEIEQTGIMGLPTPADQRHEIDVSPFIGDHPASNISPEESVVIERHTSFHHPEYGPLDSLFVPYDAKSYLLSSFQRALGASGGMQPLDQWDSETFLTGVADLYDAATTLTKHGGDWFDGRHPIVAADRFGSQTVGTMYVRLAHTNLSAIEQLPIDDLPIELGTIVQWDTASNEHYTAIYHHEDYPDDSAVESHVRVSEYADDINLLDVYTGFLRFRRLPLYQIGDFIKMNPVDTTQVSPTVRANASHLFTGDILQPLAPRPPKSKLYYEKTPNNIRSAHEWVERPHAASSPMRPLDPLTHVYLFDSPFDETDVEAATLLDRHRLDESVGDYFGLPPTASETAHTLRELSPDDKVRLTLHDGRQITATVAEGPYHTSVSWSRGERTTGGLGLVVDATETEDYRWLNEEQNGRIEISADKRRGWQRPFASTWRLYDDDSVTRDDQWIDLGKIQRVDTEGV